ncbi:MAG: GumC family protein, partial [Deltaproteobacteria bacterium]|nr:GumC family protein [Deltaproteobacteria bacterium]
QPYIEGPDTEQTVHLAEYYAVLLRNKWIIVISLAVMVFLGLVHNLRLRPVYSATATMVIDKQQNQTLISQRNDYEAYFFSTLSFNTHFELIKSRAVMERVIKKLKMDQDKEENPPETNPIRKFFSRFRMNIFFIIRGGDNPAAQEDRLAGLVQYLQGIVNIEYVEDTRIFKIDVTSIYPKEAKDVANAVAESYIEFDIDSRMKSSQNTLSWVTDYLYEVTKKLEDSEAKFIEFKQKTKLITMEDSQTVTTQKIREFNDTYIETRNKRLILDAKLEQLEKITKSGKGIPHLSALVDNKLIENLYSQLVNAEVELSKLMKVYKSKHPKVVKARTNTSNIRNKIRGELKKEVVNLEVERSILLARENVLQDTMDDFEKEGIEKSKKELEYSILKRNVEVNQSLYNSLLVKMKEADIMGNTNISNLRITGKATLPQHRSGPNKFRNFLLSIIIGLMTGIGISFLLEYIDTSLRTEDDVYKYLNKPVLTIVPLVRQDDDKSPAAEDGPGEVTV